MSDKDIFTVCIIIEPKLEEENVECLKRITWITERSLP